MVGDDDVVEEVSAGGDRDHGGTHATSTYEQDAHARDGTN
jgi:hypothetical protein